MTEIITKNKILIIGLLIVFGLGIGIGKDITPSVSPEEIENQVRADLEQKLNSKTEKGLVFFGFSLSGEEKTAKISLRGKIIKIQGNSLSMEVSNRYEGGTRKIGTCTFFPIQNL